MPDMSTSPHLPGVVTAAEICEIPHPLERAIALVGLARLARALGKTHQAIRKWQAAGRMPRTEWTGETAYSAAIERLTDGQITKQMLLGPWPKWAQPRKQAARREVVAS
jgi:hypothetical protein